MRADRSPGRRGCRGAKGHTGILQRHRIGDLPVQNGKADWDLYTALRGATALAQLQQARHGFATAETADQRDTTTAALINAGEQLRQAADDIDGFFRLAEASWTTGRRGRNDLN